MAATAAQRPQRVQRMMLLKVVYTLESNTHHTLVARIPQQVNVTVLPPPKIRGACARREAAGVQPAETAAPPSQRFAAITLKQCLGAICMASPDLFMDTNKDYIIYAVDAVENYKIARCSSSDLLPSPAGSSEPTTSSHRSVLSGKGYFSRALEEHADGTSTVNGRIVGASLSPNLLYGTDDDDDEDEEEEETLEVVLRLKEAERSSRDQYLSILGGLQQQQQQQAQVHQQQQQLHAQHSPRMPDTGPLPSSGPLALAAASSATPVLAPASTCTPSAGHTPVTGPEGLPPSSSAGLNDPSHLAPSPGTQAQLLSLLQMLQQRQPTSDTANSTSSPLADITQASVRQPAASNQSTVLTLTDGLPASTGTQQQQLAEVLGGLAGMMGIALPAGFAYHDTGRAAPSSAGKRGSLDAVAGRRTKRRIAPTTARAELPTAGPSPLPGATATLLGPGGAPASSRATSVDGDNASITSGPSEKKERKYARRAARERAAAAAAAAVAERDRVAATPPAIEATTPHPASEAGPIPTKKVSARLGGKKGKKQDVRAGAAALAAMQPPAKIPAASQKEMDFSSSTTKIGAFSSGSARQGVQVSFPQSSPIRHSSSSDATKVNSSQADMATPMTSSISHFAFPKHLLQSSPGTAFGSLLSEGDLDFDGFAIPQGLFGSPNMINNAVGGPGSRQARAADEGAEETSGRCPSTPLRRSPRKKPTGTHASMNPYASLNADNDLFGTADNESPLFGFVNMSPATARSGSHSSRLKTLDGLMSSGDGHLDDVGPNDPFGSPSAHRAQRRVPSGQGNTMTPSGSKDAQASKSAGSIASLSALMVSPNLNEVDFAALLRANVGGAGGASANLNGALEGHALLTGSPSGPPRTDMG